jgi:hypothetical protein
MQYTNVLKIMLLYSFNIVVVVVVIVVCICTQTKTLISIITLQFYCKKKESAFNLRVENKLSSLYGGVYWTRSEASVRWGGKFQKNINKTKKNLFILF